MLKIKDKIRKKYKGISKDEFDLLWSFVMDNELIKLAIEKNLNDSIEDLGELVRVGMKGE